MAIVEFPPLEATDEQGLLAVGGDLEISSLLLAYSQGIFPWPISVMDPLAWFSPDPRGILEYQDLHISKSMQKLINKNIYEVRFNTNFPEVITNCALAKNRKDELGTWITEKIVDSYIDFHYAGHAYSVETYLKGTDKLVGGMYGVYVNGSISGESMFYKENNASKMALIALMQHLHKNGIDWLDTQMVTPVVKALGGKEVPRDEFLKKLKNSRQVKKKIF
jgi:leucyl/phenylalanyl-tRNA--protein transferase